MILWGDIKFSACIVYTICDQTKCTFHPGGCYKTNVCGCVCLCVRAALASQEHFGPQSVCPDLQAPDRKKPEAPPAEKNHLRNTFLHTFGHSIIHVQIKTITAFKLHFQNSSCVSLHVWVCVCTRTTRVCVWCWIMELFIYIVYIFFLYA